MNNKVTLPPISDIFATKDVGPLEPPQNPHHSPYPVMPVYQYQYMYNPRTQYVNPPYGVHAAGGHYTPYAHPMAAQYHHQPSVPGMSPPAPMMQQGHRRSLVGLPTLPGLPRSDSLTPEASGISSRSRTRNNLPKETTYILLRWLNDHLNHPYPNSFEKTQLMITTGLNQQQLSNWFINARRRKIKTLRQKQKLASA